MVRSGGDGVRALGNHSSTRNIAHGFCSGQMSADSRLCTLSHFDFYCCTCVEISLMYAETTGRNLNDGVFAETVKILMESAFARVVANAEKFRRLCKALVSIVAD